MNRRILRLLLMGFLPFQVSAQLTDNILTTPTYRMGSYQRLDELRMNHPTLHPTLVKQAMIGKIKRYIVRYADSNKRVKREIYGFAQRDTMRQYVVAYNERHQHELPDFTTSLEAKVVIYRRDKKEREEAIVITSSDSTVATLHPNEYQELMIAPRQMQFCSGTTCVTITPSTQRTNYLKCSFPRKDPEASLEEVETKVGSFYVRQIGYKQAKQ